MDNPGKTPATAATGGASISRRRFLVAGGAVAGLALAGCSGKGSSASGGTKTLTAWEWSAAGELRDVFHAVKAAYPDEFKGVEINVQVVGAGDTDVVSKLNLALSAGGTLPDFLKLDYPEMAPFAEAGVLADFSEFVTPQVENDLLSGAVAATRYKGKYYAVSRMVQGKAFWYRNDLFKEAGIDPNAITSMEDYIAAGHKFTRKFPGRHIINIGTASGGEDWFDQVASAYKGVVFDADNFAFNSPAVSKAFGFWRQIRESGIAYPTDDFATDWAPAIMTGKICGFLDPTWMTSFIPGYATRAQKGKWSSILTPPFTPEYADQSYGGDLGSDIYLVPKDAPNRDLAMSFLSKARLEEKGSMAAFKAAAWTPMRRSLKDWTLEAVTNSERPAGMSATDWALQPQQYFGRDVFETAFAAYDRVQVVDYGSHFVDEMAILGPWMSKAINGQISVANAISGMQNDMRSQIH